MVSSIKNRSIQVIVILFRLFCWPANTKNEVYVMGLGTPYGRWKKKNHDKLPALVLACGPEETLKRDFIELVQKKFPAEGREVVSVFADDSTPEDLMRELESGGLFSSSKLVILKRLEQKNGSKTQLERYRGVLEEYIKNPNPENTLVLEDIDHPYKRGRKVGMFARLIEDNGGWALVFWEPFASSLRQELRDRFKEAELSVDPAALQLLLEKTQGKLARVRMEADKLIQLCEDRVDVEDVEGVTGREAASDIYQQLKDSLLSGNMSEIMRAMAELERSGEAPVAIFFVTFDFLNTLRSLRQLLNRGQKLSEALKELGIPGSGGIVRKYNRALSRLKGQFPHDFYRKSYDLSRQVKYMRKPFNQRALELFLLEMLPRLQVY
jgi:DNA polymerase III delta subunit